VAPAIRWLSRRGLKGAGDAEANREYAIGLARAFGGAIIFGYPLMMTMEMWWLGFHMDRARLLLFLAITLAMLCGLSFFAGFQQASSAKAVALDALSAFGVAVIASALALMCFGILTAEMSLDELAGKLAIQAIPASFGASLARKQLGSKEEEAQEEQREARAGYKAQLFLMTAGALYMAFSVAPTEEMLLIAYKMTPWHGLALAFASIALLHAFVYAVGFGGQESVPEGAPRWTAFANYTLAGYGIAIVVSLYVLFTFGRTDDVALPAITMMTVVLAFPSALGAAIARLVV